MRVGIGYDIHKLTDDEQPVLKLAGTIIPYTKKLFAYSDGDVVIHALIDALLGAAALGDIGTHFPDNDPKYKDADSALLLQNCLKLIEKENYSIENIDINIMAEKPKLAPYIYSMRCSLSEIMGIEMTKISIKSKTNEKLDAIGREEAIAAQAVVLIA